MGGRLEQALAQLRHALTLFLVQVILLALLIYHFVVLMELNVLPKLAQTHYQLLVVLVVHHILIAVLTGLIVLLLLLAVHII